MAVRLPCAKAVFVLRRSIDGLCRVHMPRPAEKRFVRAARTMDCKGLRDNGLRVCFSLWLDCRESGDTYCKRIGTI